MPKLPRVTGKEVLGVLRRGGFELTHVKGSHHYLRRPGSNKLVTVPVHAGEIIPLKTLQSILEQSELTIDKFIELL